MHQKLLLDKLDIALNITSININFARKITLFRINTYLYRHNIELRYAKIFSLNKQLQIREIK